MVWPAPGAESLMSGLILIRSITGATDVGQPGLRHGRSSTEVRLRSLLFALVGVSGWCQSPHAALTSAALWRSSVRVAGPDPAERRSAGQIHELGDQD